jgi:purine-cytosine permease-like protein
MPHYQRRRSRRSKNKWNSVMKNNLIKITAAATVAIGAAIFPTAAQARWHPGFPVAPVVGGLAAGALIGAALAAPRYYYGYEPINYGMRCVLRRERFWDGWGWHVRRVEDCY